MSGLLFTFAFALSLTRKISAEVSLCKHHDSSEPVCISDDPPSALIISECCNHQAPLFENLESCNIPPNIYPINLSTHYCSKVYSIKLLEPHSSYFRLEVSECSSSLMPATLSIYSKSPISDPIILSVSQGSLVLPLRVFEYQSRSTGYKYKASASVYSDKNTEYKSIFLRQGNLSRKCYNSSNLSGSFLSDYDITSITNSNPSSNTIFCSFEGYYIPLQNGNLMISIASNAYISISIRNTLNTFSSKSCNPDLPCSSSAPVLGGKAYYIFIKADNRSSNLLNFSSFEISDASRLYHSTYTHSSSSFACTNFLSPSYNKSFQGAFFCPTGVYKCNLLDSDNRFYSALIPKYCTNIPECVANASIVDNLCKCDDGYAENHTEGTCEEGQYRLEMNLFKDNVNTLDFDVAVLIVSNPCTRLFDNWFCQEQESNNLLYTAILKEFTYKDTRTLSASAYLAEGSYSITINYLKQGGLLKQCWDEYNINSSYSLSEISDFTYSDDYNYNTCIWEGFFKAPVSDLEMSIFADDLAFVWIKDYSNISWYCPFPGTFNINLIQNKLYYIRVQVHDSGGPSTLVLKWKQQSSGTWNNFSTDMLYYPSRPYWGISHISSFDSKIHIPSNNIDKGVYHCPYKCISCEIYYGGYQCTGCGVDRVLDDGKCVCQEGYGESDGVDCIQCPEFARKCKYEIGILEELECKEGTIRIGTSCIRSDCYVNLVIDNVDDMAAEDAIVLDIMESSLESDTWISSQGKHRAITQYSTSMNLDYISTRTYNLSILSLKQGYLSYEQWSSSSYSDLPVISSISPLSSDLSSLSSGIARYQGYFSFPLSGVVGLSVLTNTNYKIYILDDSDTIKSYTSQYFELTLTQNKYYFLRIDFTITTNTYIKIYLYKNGESILLSDDYLYYPTRALSSVIIVSQCNLSYIFTHTDIETGLQLCPDRCVECNQQISYESIVGKESISRECVSCIELTDIKNGLCECIEGYRYNTEKKICEEYSVKYCARYDDEFKCIECEGNFSLIIGECSCDEERYEFEGETCKEKLFTLSIASYTNMITLTFNTPLLYPLTQDALSFIITNSTIQEKLQYSLQEISPSLIYSYNFLYPISIDTSLIAYIQFQPQISNIYNTPLQYSSYDFELILHFSYSIPDTDTDSDIENSPESIQESQSNNTEAPLEISTQSIALISSGVTSVTAVTSILNSSPDSFLLMMNTLQIFRYLLLLNINLPKRVKAMCQGYDPLNILPNTVGNIFTRSGVELGDKFKDVGYDTADFIINSGKQIAILLYLIGVYITLRLIWKMFHYGVRNTFIERMYSKISRSFVYANFLILWLEAYLEFIITAGINLSHPKFEAPFDTINYIASLFIMALALFSPVILMRFYIRNYSNLKNESFAGKWNVLYGSYDLNKACFILEGIYFLVRRIVFGLSILILGSAPYIQILVNSTASYGVIVFYIYFKPFENRKDLYMNVFLESCCFIVMSGIAAFTKEDLSEDWGNVIDWGISVVLYASVIVPCLVNLYDLLKKIRSFIRMIYARFRNRRRSETRG